MTPRLTLMFFVLSFFIASSVYGQTQKRNTPDLKGATFTDYYITVKLVDKEPIYKPTYLLASKPDYKQKKWNLDTTKIDIDKYFLKNRSIHRVYYSEKDCACNQFSDTTGNGVYFILLKPSSKLLPVPELLRKVNIPSDSLDRLEIFINGKQVTDDTVLIDSEAEVLPIYRNGEVASKGNIVGADIWTLTKEQRKKYGM